VKTTLRRTSNARFEIFPLAPCDGSALQEADAFRPFFNRSTELDSALDVRSRKAECATRRSGLPPFREANEVSGLRLF
jgi:hypothetical protein